MAGLKSKPKRSKKYTPRKVNLNPMRIAMNRQAALTQEERAQIISANRLAVEKLRIGNFTKQNWDDLAESANIGCELAYMQICSDADSVSALVAMLNACDAICQRFNKWGKWQAIDDELAALDPGIDTHKIQLMFASTADLKKACANYMNDIGRAKAINIKTTAPVGEGCAA